MNKYILIIQIVLLSIFVSGCAQKVRVKALQPAEIDRVTSIKKIAVVKFKNDRVGLSSKIESNLANSKIDNKVFFTIVSRSDINKVLQEQRFQNSGLVDATSVVEVGNLLGAQAIISANVGNPSLGDSHFYEQRSKCADKKCKERIKYKVRCVKRVIGLSAEIKMVDITLGDIIYADNISKTLTNKHCKDDSNVLPSKALGAQKLSQSIANSFTYKLTPHYHYFNVELLEDPDLDYNDNQEILLESSLEYIKQNRYDKAQKLLSSLVDSTSQQSYVAFYNLGVVKEAKGEYLKAKDYYAKADALVIKPVDTISKAYIRINSVILNHQISQEQMNR